METEMTIWHNSKMTSLYFSDDEASEHYDCVVKIENGRILVEYELEEGGLAQYEGQEIGAGHFTLEYPEGAGKASLHMFPDSVILEGSWVEGGERGMWKIHLA